MLLKGLIDSQRLPVVDDVIVDAAVAAGAVVVQSARAAAE